MIVYLLTGLQPSATKFFIFWGFLLLTNIAATSLALAISALARTTDAAVLALPIALEISRLFGGFFISPANMPAYFKWLDSITYVKVCGGADSSRGRRTG